MLIFNSVVSGVFLAGIYRVGDFFQAGGIETFHADDAAKGGRSFKHHCLIAIHQNPVLQVQTQGTGQDHALQIPPFANQIG